jgi:hypothetical protein
VISTLLVQAAAVYAVWSGADGLMAKVPGNPPYVLSKTSAFALIAPEGPVIAAWEDNGKIRTRRMDRPTSSQRFASVRRRSPA